MSRDRDRHKRSRDYSRERDRERDRSRERDKHSSRDRHEGSSSSRRSEHREHRDRDRERDRRRSSRDKSRSRSRSRDRDRHRDRRSGGSGQPDQQPGDASLQQQQQQQQQAQANGLSAEQQAEAHKKKREAEQNALDVEMEERRKRVEEWRKKRAAEAAAAAAAEQERKQQEEAAAAAAAAAAVEAEGGANGGKKGWSLEDDEDDDEPQQQPEGDEPDPLDAFMAGNAAAAAAPVKQEQPQSQDVVMTDAAAAAAADNTDTGQAAAAGAGAAGAAGGGGIKAEPGTAAAAADDDEPDPLDAFMANEVLPEVRKPPTQQQAAAAAAADEEPDPLDAFMASEVLPEVQKVRWSQQQPAAKAEPSSSAAGGTTDAAAGGGAAAAKVIIRPGSSGGRKFGPSAAASGSKGGGGGSKGGATKQKQRRRYYDTSSESDWTDSEEEAPEEEAELDDETWAKNVTAGKLSKGDKLAQVDHATVQYEPFRRRFYIEVPEIQRMSEEEVALLRKTEGIKTRGVDVPRPVKTWTQCGINVKVLDVLKRNGFERPLSIQAQALPIIMSGRDCIGIAKTGSGKTLAFVLPLLRHIRDQAELRDGDGPIGLIMAPTRELVQQIAKEVKRFGGPMMISCTPVFGGAGVANQITELKRGTEVVAATPGRLIDLLVSRVTNLRRVTYLVLDEADRMFDMGFEPQITRIINNTRPDRQTVMFSATFPRAVETLARQILNNPVEIQVGGRSVVNADIAQFVEIRPEADRFLRLLEILGEWYEVGKIIIFVHSQDNCDSLFRDLLKAGYPCLSLHGGKDQSDRECTISDFKGDVCNILVATSIAARGLDVRDLVLVVNYDVPNHHEDYVHRVGRTGRAGNKGTAITFIGPDEDRYAPDLVKALKESSATVPQDLQELADAFNTKRKQGLVQGHGSGYGGSGFKFDKAEDNKVRQARKSKAKEFGIVGQEEEEEGGSESDDDIRPSTCQQTGIVVTPAAAAAVAAAINAPGGVAGAAGLPGAPKFLPAQPGQQFPGQAVPQAASALVAAAAAAAAQVSGASVPTAAVPSATASLANAQAAAMRAAALAAAFAQGGGAPASAPSSTLPLASQQLSKPTGFESEIEINDFPQNARWKVTHKGFQQEITDLTGAAVTTKGIYVAQGAQPPEGERKLYLLIEAPTEAMVKRAKQEVRRVIEELVEKAMRRDVGAAGTRKYNIM